MSDKSIRIGFIGGGNMAGAMIGGLIQSGYQSSFMTVAEPWEEARLRLKSQFAVKTTTTNTEAVFDASTGKPADVLVLAVKPQVMKTVAEGIAALVQQHKPLVISIAAGIAIEDLKRWLMNGQPVDEPAIVRCMPNTPALVVEGATGVFAAQSVSEKQKQIAFAILESVSKRTYWVASEYLLNVVTGISGSAPAYFFLLVECLEAAGVELGLPKDVARGLASQTALGAGKMLISTGEDPADLRKKVTSPNGTTERAIQSLEASGMRQAFADAVKRATERSVELGDILGKQ